MNARKISFTLAAGALFFAAAPAAAQQSMAECPTAEPGETTPIELRIAGMVLRAHVSTAGGGAAGDSTRLDARLVSCEDPLRRAGEPDARADDGVLRLLNDLRFGIQFTPSADGRCFRAQIEVADESPSARRSGVDEPLGFELCGLPLGRSSSTQPSRRM